MHLIIILSALFVPSHDFHTTILNFTYLDDEKTFQIDLTVDTEQFQYSLNKEFEVDMRLGEPNELSTSDDLINRYLGEHVNCKINGKHVLLKIDTKEVTFAETTLHLKPFKQKKKLKKIEMSNRFMINDFPNQKNLVNYFYKGRSESMLFGANTSYAEIIF